MTAYADTGPKPSVAVDFKGLENETYYATLLSQTASTGPFNATIEDDLIYVPENVSAEYLDEYIEDYNLRCKFASYEDVDGYYFLDFYGDCSETSQFVWSYHPPSNFKILLYFPEKDSFMVSAEIYESYAFRSYYTAYITEEIQAAANYNGGMTVEKSYNYVREIIFFLIRIIVTIVIELLIALLFGFRAKKQILVILIVNIITQFVLNILLNVINYNYGALMFLITYVLAEVGIIILEAVVYYIYLNKYSTKKKIRKWIAPLYAAAANIASFCIGVFIVMVTPWLF
jgi:hypothetical protein